MAEKQVKIRIQTEDFDQGTEYQRLAQGTQSGAVVTFIGRVRDMQDTDPHANASMHLQHYPGMTEKVLHQLTEDAMQRWPLERVTILHRIGTLEAGDQIVFVGVSSAHRKAAFNACAFIMDYLKTKAPLWKKEGGRWVEAKDSDRKAANAWQHTNGV